MNRSVQQSCLKAEPYVDFYVYGKTFDVHKIYEKWKKRKSET